MVVAMARHGVIGRGNTMPWHLPADLAHFKKTTMGHTMLMGSATYRSIGRPLPGRTTWVVSGSMEEAPGIRVFRSLQAALEEANLKMLDTLMVVGGGTLYKALIDKADEIIVTRIDLDTEGDTFFPDIPSSDWVLHYSEPHSKDEINPFDYIFEHYRRRA